jgi:hypothetical protein
MTNAHSEMGQMAVCCQNLMLGELGSRSVQSVLVGTLFEKFVVFLNMPCICLQKKYCVLCILIPDMYA